MSRGGRGGGRGSGRGGFGANNLPPMGLTFADIQSMSREATALYPPLDPLPVLTEYTAEEKRICELQIGFATRLHQSPYYIIEQTKSTELPRYSDKYRPSAAARPVLRRKDLHQPFFPQEIFEGYFNPKKRKASDKKGSRKRINLDELDDEVEDAEKSGDERSDAGSQAPEEEDYDVDEEYDNDYADNYFDNGEGDDFDDLGGGGGGGDEGGGGYDYD